MSKVITVKNISMVYRMTEGNIRSIKEYVIRFFKRKLKRVDFHALEDINLEVEKGEIIGIIGTNGSGKSTFLKIVSGILVPTSGEVEVQGNTVPLLELGCGFDTELSGRENIYLNAAILGFNKKFIDEKYDEIVEFSELGDFINQPLRTYSSGMTIRLGFAIAAMMNPEILICDEILAVGDDRFQEKSKNKMKELMSNGATVLFVSHDINAIKNMCTRVMWLDKGKIRMLGDTEEVTNAYINRES